MAVKVKKAAERVSKREIVDIFSTHTDEEIVALEEKGYRLRFSAEDFRDLSDKTQRALSFENMRDYAVTKGAATALKKNGKRRDAGFEGIEIEDPLRGNPHNKLEVRGKLPGWHYCWKRPDEVADAKAHQYVIADEAEAPGATKTSSSHTIQRKDGKDDLVLMRVPERLFQQHLQANALESRKRAGATMKTVADQVRKANRSLEDVPLPGMIDTTTEDEVPMSQDMRKTS